jgi:hypothetical protein
VCPFPTLVKSTGYFPLKNSFLHNICEVVCGFWHTQMLWEYYGEKKGTIFFPYRAFSAAEKAGD